MMNPIDSNLFRSNDNTNASLVSRELKHVETTSLPRMKKSILSLYDQSERNLGTNSVNFRNLSQTRNESGMIS